MNAPRVHQAIANQPWMDMPEYGGLPSEPSSVVATVTIAWPDGRVLTATGQTIEHIAWAETEETTKPGDEWKSYRVTARHLRVQLADLTEIREERHA